jgi:hypothetical protein
MWLSCTHALRSLTHKLSASLPTCRYGVAGGVGGMYTSAFAYWIHAALSLVGWWLVSWWWLGGCNQPCLLGHSRPPASMMGLLIRFSLS